MRDRAALLSVLGAFCAGQDPICVRRFRGRRGGARMWVQDHLLSGGLVIVEAYCLSERLATVIRETRNPLHTGETPIAS